MLHFELVPTTRPRYTLTDTGRIAAMLDEAQQRWPEETDRKALLLRLAELGAERVGEEREAEERAARRERQERALARIREGIDVELLLSDAAWR